ncbi:hypothetical protein [Acidipropionibacterium virtanenii]
MLSDSPPCMIRRRAPPPRCTTVQGRSSRYLIDTSVPL